MSVQWIDDDRTYGALGQQVRRLSPFCPPYAGPARWHFWITVGGHAPTETYLANATQDQALAFAGKLLQAQVGQFPTFSNRPPIVHVRADRQVGDSWCVAFVLSSQVPLLQPLSGAPEGESSALGEAPEVAEESGDETEEEGDDPEDEGNDEGPGTVGQYSPQAMRPAQGISPSQVVPQPSQSPSRSATCQPHAWTFVVGGHPTATQVTLDEVALAQLKKLTDNNPKVQVRATRTDAAGNAITVSVQ